MSANAAQAAGQQSASPSQYRVGCQLAGGTIAFPNIVITNASSKALAEGQTIDVAFSSGIRFVVNLPQALAPGAYLQMLLPDTVNGVPTGMCTAGIGN